MIIDKYLVITAKEGRYGGFTGSARLVEKSPKLRGDEISLRLKLDVPDAFFQRPQLEASISVPATEMQKSKITTAVADNVEKVIKAVTGLTMSVSIVEHPEEEDNG
jgi:hypothetical protein